MKAPQEARGRVWVEEILSVSPCAANGCEWRRKLPVRNRRTRSSGSGEKLVSTEGAGSTRTCSYHPGVVGRYFSVILGKDLYGQLGGESCLGMLQGGVEHLILVGGGDI